MDAIENLLEKNKELEALIAELKEENAALRLKIGELYVQQKAQKDLTANLRRSEELLRFLKQIDNIELNKEDGNTMEEDRSEKIASSSSSHCQEKDTDGSIKEDEKNYNKGEKKKSQTSKRKKRKIFDFNNDFYRYNTIDKENDVELLLHTRDNCKLFVKNRNQLFDSSSSNQCAVQCVRKIYHLEKLIDNNVRVKNLPTYDWENIVAFVRFYEQKKKKDEQDEHLLRGAVNHFLWDNEEDANESEN